ncbi:UPF0496 protein 3-like [Canna indica]|uniref:UPF0496 protein 3-like n=1 Tax=Canna indica TaxID=4628 RepID=A0AAQ3KMP3_9LILI|nr:UPF0496 protein 3-like [Canna indica]
MCIRFSIFRDCRKGRCEVVAPISSSSSFNLCEEYTNAFRTESYAEFWAQVLDLTLDHGDALKPRGSSAAARLPSYFLLLAEHLLSPDQTTVAKILAHLRTRSRPETHALLSDYYAETADASHLCGLLLKDIDQIRRRYRPLKATLHSLVDAGSSSGNGLRAVGDDISKASNPFNSIASSQRKFRAVQEDSADLLKRLESGRKKARQKRRFISRVKRAVTVSAIVLVASTSIVGALVAIHALVAAIALPGFLSASPRMGSVRRLDRAIAQLDAAAKGTYILNRDLDTISRLVARLHDETEHMHGLLRLCEWQEDDGRRRRLTREVARQIWKSLGSFNQQLDELEEHLYLCFMTINKARRLVIKELLVAN